MWWWWLAAALATATVTSTAAGHRMSVTELELAAEWMWIDAVEVSEVRCEISRHVTTGIWCPGYGPRGMEGRT